MLEKVVQNDFSGGILSEKFGGRFDLPVYAKSVSQLTNWIPAPQGGITFRTGTDYCMAPTAKTRLIPYVCSPSTSFIVAVSNAVIRILSAGSVIATISTGVPYTLWQDILEIQYAQIDGSLYLVHRNHKPQVLTWTSGVNFTFGEMSVTGQTVDFDGQAVALPFQSSGNYPGAISAINGRAVFAGSINEPQKIWMSKPFKYTNFTFYETVDVTYDQLKPAAQWADPHTAETESVTVHRNVVTDASAMEIELASDENEYIVGMVCSKELIVLTSCGEWIIPEDVVATSPSATLQSRHGSARIQPIMVGDRVYFASSPKSILAYSYASVSDAWGSQDVSFNSELLAPGVTDVDFAQHPSQALYCVLKDGTVAILQINPSLNSAGWWLFTSSGIVESLAIIPGSDGDDDVYISVKRGSTWSVEKMNRTFAGTHLDNSITATAGNGTVSGLAALNGLSVYAVNEATVIGPGTVAAGVLTLAGLVSGTSYRIGVAFTGTMRTLRIQTTGPDGQTQQMAEKRIARVMLRLYASLSIKIGRTVTVLEPLIHLTAFSGDDFVTFPGDYDKDGYVYVIQDQPLAATILALITEVQ